MMDIQAVHTQARDLRTQRKFQEAYQFVVDKTHELQGLKGFAWENQPIFWNDIAAGMCKLTRRNASDAPFIQELWREKDFLYSFHRHATDLPKTKGELEKILEREFISTMGASKSLHWIVRDKRSQPWGILSLTDISLAHKRAEVLLGVLPGAPTGLSVSAMLILFYFFFKVMKFNKLYSLVYDDNMHSLKGTLHLGFREEGRLRKHVVDPKSGKYVDLVQTGLLVEDAFNPRTKRLMQRLFSASNPGRVRNAD
jgi:RimJ/RimL family protein N-acetyltransferase